MNFVMLASVIGSVMSVIGASYKIVEILEYEPKIKNSGGKQLGSDCKGEISINKIKFSYPSKPDVEVLKGISLEVKKNKVIAIVGTSGCGKSSLIAMIERFYDPNSGSVCFDGTNIKELDPRWYH